MGLQCGIAGAVPASLSSVLKTVGDLTLCQKINDAHWKRTDMKSVAGGILAGSLGTTLSGLIGGVGQSTFSSNVGLSMATGGTSRAIALLPGPPDRTRARLHQRCSWDIRSFATARVKMRTTVSSGTSTIWATVCSARR